MEKRRRKEYEKQKKGMTGIKGGRGGEKIQIKQRREIRNIQKNKYKLKQGSRRKTNEQEEEI